MRNLTKSCIQNYKFVRVLDKYMYAAVLLGLKESNLPKTSLIIISSTILPSVPRATCQLPKFWHAQKAKFQDSNYLIDLKLTLPLCFLFCPLLSIFLPSPPPPTLLSLPSPFPFSEHLASFGGKSFAKTFRIVGLQVGSARFSLDFSGQLYIIYGSLHFSLLCLIELAHSDMVWPYAACTSQYVDFLEWKVYMKHCFSFFLEVWWMPVETSLLLTFFHPKRQLEREKETLKLKWTILRMRSE